MKPIALAIVLIVAIYILVLSVVMAHGALPPGTHLMNEVNEIELWTPGRVHNNRVLDSMIRADSVVAMWWHDSIKRLQDRPRQRLDRQDSVWLEWK